MDGAAAGIRAHLGTRPIRRISAQNALLFLYSYVFRLGFPKALVCVRWDSRTSLPVEPAQYQLIDSDQFQQIFIVSELIWAFFGCLRDHFKKLKSLYQASFQIGADVPVMETRSLFVETTTTKFY